MHNCCLFLFVFDTDFEIIIRATEMVCQFILSLLLLHFLFMTFKNCNKKEHIKSPLYGYYIGRSPLTFSTLEILQNDPKIPSPFSILLPDHLPFVFYLSTIYLSLLNFLQ